MIDLFLFLITIFLHLLLKRKQKIGKIKKYFYFTYFFEKKNVIYNI